MSSCRPATARSCSSPPRPRRTPSSCSSARRSRAWRSLGDVRTLVIGDRDALVGRAGKLPRRMAIAPWASYARTMPACAVVVCHAGHGTLARALASGCVAVCAPMAGDMNECAARVDWAGAGVRIPRRLIGRRSVRLAVERALGEPRLATAAAAFAGLVRRARSGWRGGGSRRGPGRGTALSAASYSGGGTRTHNLSINSRELCRLSYPGLVSRGRSASGPWLHSTRMRERDSPGLDLRRGSSRTAARTCGPRRAHVDGASVAVAPASAIRRSRTARRRRRPRRSASPQR